MAEPRVTALRSVYLGVRDVDASARFYVDIWGLEPVAADGGSVYLRGTGSYHHILALHPASHAELLSVNFAAKDKSEIDGLYEKAKAFGVTELEAPKAIDGPGGGYGFSLKDREGRVLRIISGDSSQAESGDVADRPRKLSHAVFNSSEVELATEFFADVFGFKLSDRTRIMNFVRCNSDHHSVAFAHGPASTLNHIAYEMPDLDSVMRGAGRMSDEGFPIEWGVGRHGPGNNVFAYFVGPDNVVIEYTGEVDQVDDDYKTGQPEDWTWPPGRVDRWGISTPPSGRIKEAQQQIKFAHPLFDPAA
jgi:catechol 2,3-dioxygenase-like lactoylglutathione lyase family enzyme